MQFNVHFIDFNVPALVATWNLDLNGKRFTFQFECAIGLPDHRVYWVVVAGVVVLLAAAPLLALFFALCFELLFGISDNTKSFISESRILFSLSYWVTSNGKPVTRFIPEGIKSTVNLNCATTSPSRNDKKIRILATLSINWSMKWKEKKKTNQLMHCTYLVFHKELGTVQSSYAICIQQHPFEPLFPPRSVADWMACFHVCFVPVTRYKNQLMNFKYCGH